MPFGGAAIRAYDIERTLPPCLAVASAGDPNNIIVTLAEHFVECTTAAEHQRRLRNAGFSRDHRLRVLQTTRSLETYRQGPEFSDCCRANSLAYKLDQSVACHGRHATADSPSVVVRCAGFNELHAAAMSLMHAGELDCLALVRVPLLSL